MDFKNDFILISYYTDDYSDYARNLQDSCNYNNIVDYDIEKVPDLGSWKDNTNFKPHFIKKKLEQYKKPVLYLDSDAIVRTHLDFFNNMYKEYDMAVYYRKGRELLSGTIYFDYNKDVLDLIDLWIEKINKNPDVWDQRNFQMVVEEILVTKNDSVGSFYVGSLPSKFCAFDLMIRNGEVKENEVEILHFQASRIHNENHPLKGRMELLGLK